MTTPNTQVVVDTANSQTDRFFKIKLRDELLHLVYNIWEKRLASQMDELIMNNSLLNPSMDYCLRLRGVCYWHTSLPDGAADYYPRNKLHPSLKDYAHSWVEQHTEISSEKRLVSHSLSAILAASNRLEDYLKLLPDSLHELCKSYQPLFPDPTLHKQVSLEVMKHLQFIHRPYLALMGQRYVMSLIF